MASLTISKRENSKKKKDKSKYVNLFWKNHNTLTLREAPR